MHVYCYLFKICYDLIIRNNAAYREAKTVDFNFDVEVSFEVLQIPAGMTHEVESSLLVQPGHVAAAYPEGLVFRMLTLPDGRKALQLSQGITKVDGVVTIFVPYYPPTNIEVERLPEFAQFSALRSDVKDISLGAGLTHRIMRVSGLAQCVVQYPQGYHQAHKAGGTLRISTDAGKISGNYKGDLVFNGINTTKPAPKTGEVVIYIAQGDDITVKTDAS